LDQLVEETFGDFVHPAHRHPVPLLDPEQVIRSLELDKMSGLKARALLRMSKDAPPGVARRIAAGRFKEEHRKHDRQHPKSLSEGS
jgi:hypothetical protein